MDSALNIAETVRDHPLADRIGQIVKEKTVKKEDKSQAHGCGGASRPSSERSGL